MIQERAEPLELSKTPHFRCINKKRSWTRSSASAESRRMRALILRTIREYLLKRELRASCLPTWRHCIKASSEVESGEAAPWFSSAPSQGSGANRAGKKEFTSLFLQCSGQPVFLVPGGRILCFSRRSVEPAILSCSKAHSRINSVRFPSLRLSRAANCSRSALRVCRTRRLICAFHSPIPESLA